MGLPTGDDTRKMVNGVKYHGIVWPPLAQLRGEFEKKFGPQEWVRPHSEWVSAEGKTAEEIEEEGVEAEKKARAGNSAEK